MGVIFKQHFEVAVGKQTRGRRHSRSGEWPEHRDRTRKGLMIWGAGIIQHGLSSGV